MVKTYKFHIAMEAMQAILAFIVGIASIWGSVLCCKVACCCNTTGQVGGILFAINYLRLGREPFEYIICIKQF